MSDGLDLPISSARLCSSLSSTIKNTEAFDFSSSSITRLTLYALFLLLAPLHPGRHQYNWGAGCSGCVLNLCIFTPFLVLLQERELLQIAFHTASSLKGVTFHLYLLIGSANQGLFLIFYYDFMNMDFVV